MRNQNIPILLVFLAGAALLSAVVTYFHTISQTQKYSLFDQHDLAIVNFAYDQDSTPQALTAKNDDGHTKIWNAAASKLHSPVPDQRKAKQDSNMFGVPKFFAHATGWVDDYGEPSPSSHSSALSASEATQTTKLLQDTLWNAAKNDEITVKSVGHWHASEMREVQKLSPEYKSMYPTITDARSMDFHPLKWMKEQKDPSAISTQKTTLPASKLQARTSELLMTEASVKLQKPRLQELWNAGADDEIGGDPQSDERGHVEFQPRRWLRNQKDDAEMADLHSRRSKRVFARADDHEGNFQGEYVSDNSIGLNVDMI